MQKLTPIAIPALKDNYIWCIKNDHQCAVIDPGEATPVLNFLAKKRWQLTQILITHHHDDHQGGILELLAHFPYAEVYGSVTEAIMGLNRPLLGGETLKIVGLETQVMALPGHTLGHLGYYLDGALFCGDTLFGGGCGRLFEGSYEQLYESLQKISELPNDTQIFPAHEYTLQNLKFAEAVEPLEVNPKIQIRISKVRDLLDKKKPTLPSLLGEEKLTNPFLRCHKESVKKSVAEFINKNKYKSKSKSKSKENTETNENQEQILLSDLETFIALRKWRNNF